MTEEEAKGKWCPQQPVKFYETGGKEPLPWYPYCIGTACMMWRWEKSPVQAQRENDKLTDGVKAVAAGFCGLAGKP